MDNDVGNCYAGRELLFDYFFRLSYEASILYYNTDTSSRLENNSKEYAETGNLCSPYGQHFFVATLHRNHSILCYGCL